MVLINYYLCIFGTVSLNYYIFTFCTTFSTISLNYYIFIFNKTIRVRRPVYKAIWNSLCPLKVNIFNWLTWKNKILSLENLAKRRCNKLPTTTCVLCHSSCESVDHLFLHCQFPRSIWNIFLQLFDLPAAPTFFGGFLIGLVVQDSSCSSIPWGPSGQGDRLEHLIS